MNRRIGKLLWRSIGILLAVVVLFQTAFLLYFRDFYGSAEKEFWVPGLSGEFVPQGMDRLREGFLLSGYLSDSGAARLYLVEADGSARLIRLRTETGHTLVSHAGGVAVSDAFIYLAGGNGQCYVFSAEDVLDPRQTAISVVGSFYTGNRASFCCMRGQSLLVGEYAYGERYRTADNHHLITPAGDQNTALVTSFPLENDAPLGVSERPEAAYSIPERIQGMSFSSDGRAILSASSAFGASQMYLYDFGGVLADRQGILWINQAPVPLYYLDSDNCTGILHMPPHAEEITFADGKLYLLFESASRRFQYGKLVGGSYVYSLSLPEIVQETL
ncbi:MULTISPECIES: hypothetical protein [environmental samples]|jgi:hypothetical protein|uniref:hypothetical protein n=1 Tax=environmental samples TaxID=876090 RepID=UPI000335227B|nr:MULTISPECIES: hypothetical protein [environmental samples]CDC70795.1 fibronectin type III domain protein [Oscillibacter sp. CAG:155]